MWGPQEQPLWGDLQSQGSRVFSPVSARNWIWPTTWISLLGGAHLVRQAFLVAQTVKKSAFSAGDSGSVSGLGRPLGEGNGNPLQYSCLENSMDWGAWGSTVHRVEKSRTQLSNWAQGTLCIIFTTFLEIESDSEIKSLTGAYYTEWSKPERKTPIQYNNTNIWNLERW